MALAKAIVTEITNERYHDSDVLRAALVYLDTGLQPIRLKPRSKAPDHAWKEFRYTPLIGTDRHRVLPEMLEYWRHDAGQRWNLGVVTGRASGNLLVLDADTPRVFQQLISKTRALSLPIYATTTPDGGHIYLRTRWAVTRVTHALEDVDVIYRGYVVAPPSTHPDGGAYRRYPGSNADTPPIASADQLAALGVCVSFQRRAQFNADTRDYLQNGHKLPEGQRNIRLFQAASQHRNHGYTHAAAADRLEDIARRSGLSAAETRRTIASAYKGTTRRRKTPQAPRGASLRAWAADQRWKGKTGNTDFAVFQALVTRYLKDTRDVFRASEREIAELTGHTRKTIRAALNRLIERGVIERAGSEDNRAALWRFTTLCSNYPTTTTVGVKDASGVFRALPAYVAQSTLWHSGFWGISARRVYTALIGADKPLTADQLEDATGLARRTIYNVLAAPQGLQHHGLIESLEDGSYSATLPDRARWKELEYITRRRAHGNARARCDACATGTTCDRHTPRASAYQALMQERHALERARRILARYKPRHRTPGTTAARHADTGTTTPQGAATGFNQAAMLEDTKAYASAPHRGTAGASTGV